MFLLCSIKFALKRAKVEWDVILVSMNMDSFDMVNIKMILYEQNVTLTMSNS